MKRVIVLTFCIALSACSTFGPAPGSSLGYRSATVSGQYGVGYSSYSNRTRFRGSVGVPYGAYDPYYFGTSRSTRFGYTPHYYQSHGVGLAYDRFHGSSLFGGHRNNLGYGIRYSGHSFGQGISHRRRH